jgi:peptide/nickel transport system ATP-binding protein
MRLIQNFADMTESTASPSSSPILSVQNLKVEFHVGRDLPFQAVKGISFDVPVNSTVALVGESGSGKSVTAMSVLRLLPDTARISGQILYRGEDLLTRAEGAMRRLRGSEISVIFQEPMSSLNPVFTVGDQIAEVLRLHQGLSRRAGFDRAKALLEEVGLPSPAQRVNSYPHQLSGGQQQRVMIAMAIACNPKLLIADEPTTALDVTVQKQILDLLARLQQAHQMSVLFITHDLAVVGDIADQVVVMQQGEIKEQGTVEQVFHAPKDIYTQALLSCRPRLDVRPRRLPVVADFIQGKVLDVTAAQRAPRLDGDTVLEVRHLSKRFEIKGKLFQRNYFDAVKDVSFKLKKGRTLGLVGESGSGKTTVGLTLMRLHQASGGEVMMNTDHGQKNLLALNDAEMMSLRRRIQIVFQNPYASLNPRFTVAQILIEPMRIHHIGSNEAERLNLSAALLERVGLTRAALWKYPHEFSGGQRQRIAIARCLTMRPEILICDESVSALDVSVQAQVLNLLLDLQDEFGMAYLFISHDLAVVRYISDEVIVMNAGGIVETADADTIYAAPQNQYTKRLLDSIPRGLQGIAVPAIAG